MKQKIAIPITNQKLSNHFGHAEYFEIIDTDNGTIIATARLMAPVHEHGKLPKWIADKGVTHIITGGIGQKAIARLQELNITMIYGVENEEPEILVQKFLANKLQPGMNLCDH